MATATKPRMHGKGAKIPPASREDLLAGIQTAAAEKGRPLSQNDFHRRKFDLRPVGHYEKEFGSVTGAIKLASDTSPIVAEREKQQRYADPVLTEAMEKIVDNGRVLRGAVTVTRSGVDATVAAADISDIIKFARFLGDEATANILDTWRNVSTEMPEGFNYTYGAAMGDTKISLNIG